MSREVRLLWLHSNLSKDGLPSLDDFAKKFSISTRQAKRDIRYLRTNLGAPLSYSRERSGYSYTKPYDIPSLFSGSLGMEIPSRTEIRQTLLKAIEEEKALRVLLENGRAVYFHPACSDERQEIFAGLGEEDGLLFIQISEIKEIHKSRRKYIKEPMLWKRKLPVDTVVEKAVFEKAGRLFTHYFFDLEDLIDFILNNRGIRLKGEASAVDRIRNAANTLLEVVDSD